MSFMTPQWKATEYGWQSDFSEILACHDGYRLVFEGMVLKKYHFTSAAMDHRITAMDVMRQVIEGDAE